MRDEPGKGPLKHMKRRNTLHAGLSQKTPKKLVVDTKLNGVSRELYFQSNKKIWGHDLQTLDFIPSLRNLKAG